eukprot:CAMPEP_0183719762 /NCGR_PEP_ID=MMETSP0737-20130205/12573_1 /TAXON_ID=385413 /ORGANISM="Thalassiosira miniscula, Strain CCMP1093" /LENGTH=319 /DNA_ID=CAMNT_0025949507 /DNA_START=149 /DNA_END=1105 /DNA_ORIENTATION=-
MARFQIRKNAVLLAACAAFVFRGGIHELMALREIMSHSSSFGSNSSNGNGNRNSIVSHNTMDDDAPCQPHVVFTTFSSHGNKTRLRQRIENNTRYIWSTMANVTFQALMPNSPSFPSVQNNSFGMPVLGSMYLTMMERCPNATSYTYINGDIIARQRDFLDTIESVLKLGREFLIVGIRTNVPWSLNAPFDATLLHDNGNNNFNFTTHLTNGQPFNPMAEDYFIVSKNAIDWANIPPFVIGRAAYDNWIVEHTNLQPHVDVVDATNTLPVIHIDDEKGDFSWGDGQEEDKEINDIWYNKLLHQKTMGHMLHKVTWYFGK